MHPQISRLTKSPNQFIANKIKKNRTHTRLTLATLDQIYTHATLSLTQNLMMTREILVETSFFNKKAGAKRPVIIIIIIIIVKMSVKLLY